MLTMVAKPIGKQPRNKLWTGWNSIVKRTVGKMQYRALRHGEHKSVVQLDLGLGERARAERTST